jgi:hypothetical protein
MVRSCCVTVGRPSGLGLILPPSRHGPGRHSRHSVVQPAPAHPAAGHCPPGHSYPAEGDIVSGFEVLEVPDTFGVRRRSGADGAVVRRRGNRRSARRLAGLRPRLACLGHGRTHRPRAGSPPPLTRFCRRPHGDAHPRRRCGSGAPDESAGVGAEGCGVAPGPAGRGGRSCRRSVRFKLTRALEQLPCVRLVAQRDPRSFLHTLRCLLRWRARKLTSWRGPGEDPGARPAPDEKDVNREGVDDLRMDRPQPLNGPLIGDPDDQEPGFSAHLRHAVRGDQHRFGRYPGQLLDDQGGIGQQAGGVPVPC